MRGKLAKTFRTSGAKKSTKGGDPARRARRTYARGDRPAGTFRPGGGFTPKKRPRNIRRGA